MKKWVEGNKKPPRNKLVQNPGSPEALNNCRTGKGAEYSGPTDG